MDILTSSKEKEQLESLVEIQVRELKILRKRLITIERNTLYRILYTIGDIIFKIVIVLWRTYVGKKTNTKSERALGELGKAVSARGTKDWVSLLRTNKTEKRQKMGKLVRLYSEWDARLLSFLTGWEDSTFNGYRKIRPYKRLAKRVQKKN